MGRMPPKSPKPKSTKVSDTSPLTSGISTRRVTRSSPAKANKSPPSTPKKRNQPPPRGGPVVPESPVKRGRAKESTPSPKKTGQINAKDSAELKVDPRSFEQAALSIKQEKTQTPKKGKYNATTITHRSVSESSDEDEESDAEDESDTEIENRKNIDNSTINKQSNRKRIIKQNLPDIPQPAQPHNTSEVERKTTSKLLKPNESEEALNEGRNVLATMTTIEINELLERIDNQCSPSDTFNIKRRESLMDWNKVAFSSYGPRQCQTAWVFLRQQSRRIRILSEVVQEIKLKFSTSKAYQAKLIQSMPGFPQKPPTSLGGFQYFNRKEWENYKANKPPEEDLQNFVKYQGLCKEKYNALSAAEKTKYEDLSKLALAEYKRQVKEFYAENPGLAQLTARLKEQMKIQKDQKSVKVKKEGTVRVRSRSSSKPKTSKPRALNLPDPYEDAPEQPQSPAVLFIQSKLNRMKSPPTSEELPSLKKKFFEKWKRLSDDKRLNWIEYCISECLDYLELVETYKIEHPGYCMPKQIKIRQLLSKEELALWDTANGRPPNPKMSVFDVFYEEYIESSEDADLPEEERKKIAHTKWEKMDWYHKEMYKMKYKISIVEFKRNIQNYFSALPDILKPACLTRVPKKFLKMLEEVDKLPKAVPTAYPESEPEVEERDPGEIAFGSQHHEGEEGDQTEFESQEEGPPKKKKKKDKKKKRSNDVDYVADHLNFEVEEDNSEFKFEEEQYGQGHSQELNNEIEGDIYPSERKKKKKKKKHREYEDDEHETITGDVYSDSQSEGPNHVSDSLGRARHIIESVGELDPVAFENATEEEKYKFLKKQAADSKLQRTVAPALEMLKASGGRTPHVVKDNFVKKLKPSSKFFSPLNTFAQNDIFEAVRGIFDGRAHLGRKYSVYYYYAKYVSSEKFWIDSIDTDGLEKTAFKILNTFVCLNDYQKDTFIDQSFRFYFDKVHGTRICKKEDISLNSNSAVTFPGEPKPPPKKAKRLYLVEMEKIKRKKPSFSYPAWEDLDERLQTYYIKKLYHDSEVYLNRYDKFFSSMTPNDLVEYTVHRAKIWEQQSYTKQSLMWAAREFVFPFLSQESGPMDQESEPDIRFLNAKTPARMVSKKGRRRFNPFSSNHVFEKISKNMKKKVPIPMKKKKKIVNTEDNDDPSDVEMIDFSLYRGPRYLMKKKIKNAEKYFYNLDDIFGNPNPALKEKKSFESTRTKTASTQTNEVPKSKGVQRGFKNGKNKGTQTFSLRYQNYRRKAEVSNVFQSIASKIVTSAHKNRPPQSELKQSSNAIFTETRQTSIPKDCCQRMLVEENDQPISYDNDATSQSESTCSGISNEVNAIETNPDTDCPGSSNTFNRQTIDDPLFGHLSMTTTDKMPSPIKPVTEFGSAVDISRSPGVEELHFFQLEPNADITLL